MAAAPAPAGPAASIALAAPTVATSVPNSITCNSSTTPNMLGGVAPPSTTSAGQTVSSGTVLPPLAAPAQAQDFARLSLKDRITTSLASNLATAIGFPIFLWLGIVGYRMTVWSLSRTGQQSCINDRSLGLPTSSYCERILSNPTTAPPVKSKRWLADAFSTVARSSGWSSQSSSHITSALKASFAWGFRQLFRAVASYLLFTVWFLLVWVIATYTMSLYKAWASPSTAKPNANETRFPDRQTGHVVQNEQARKLYGTEGEHMAQRLLPEALPQLHESQQAHVVTLLRLTRSIHVLQILTLFKRHDHGPWAIFTPEQRHQILSYDLQGLVDEARLIYLDLQAIVAQKMDISPSQLLKYMASHAIDPSEDPLTRCWLCGRYSKLAEKSITSPLELLACATCFAMGSHEYLPCHPSQEQARRDRLRDMSEAERQDLGHDYEISMAYKDSWVAKRQRRPFAELRLNEIGV